MADEDDNIFTDSKQRVLARKYRPLNFNKLIGQHSLVKTLSGSIERNRLAHAYILTGCLLYTSPSPRDKRQSRMPSSA